MARRLKPKQYRAALMIAQGDPDHYIAEKLKLRRTTLHRWRRIPEFFDLVMHHKENMEQAVKYRLGLIRYTSASALNEGVCWGRHTDPSSMRRILDVLDYCQKLEDNIAKT